ncbi:MAG: ATP-binding protein [Bacteroidales bacterium]|nr:ATP-binding protein [Bacteroidales bacterium]
MVTKELLRQVIYEQRELTGSLGVERNVCQNISKTPEILVISGVRRCGKSVMMMQIKASQDEQDYYFNFDDDRLLHFTVEDFQTLYEVFVEDFGVQHTFYLDEIQLITGWERFVDRLYNHGNKVFVTESNAYMLSKELGTLLTGRHIKQELYPMSLDEYAKLKGMSWQKTDFFTTAGKAKMLNMQSGYLKEGGFPQYLNTGDPRYLKELYNDIIYRDIVVRHKLPSDRQIKEVAYYLASNYTHKFTYQSVAKAANIKSTETVNDYIGYLEESYLVGILTKYDNKVGEQIKSPKKVYFIDNGLVSQIGFSFSENQGKKLENAVYIELLRRDAELFYYNDNVECDFIVCDMAKITAAYQVTISLKDLETRERELNGLISAMNAFGLKEGFIITLDEIDEIEVDGNRLIHVLPYYRWCLEK